MASPIQLKPCLPSGLCLQGGGRRPNRGRRRHWRRLIGLVVLGVLLVVYF